MAQDYVLRSPNKQIQITINTTVKLTWTVAYKGVEVIAPSAISLQTNLGKIPGDKPGISDSKKEVINNVINVTVPTKSSEIDDRCNELILKFSKDFTLIFRAYNDGVAYRIILGYDKEIFVYNEGMNINLHLHDTIWFPEENSMISHYERYYKRLDVGEIKATQFCSLPALVQKTDNTYMLITEADLYNYPCMFLKGSGSPKIEAIYPRVYLEIEQLGDRSEKIIKESDYIARIKGNRELPWRVFIITDDPGKLIESNLVYQLSRPLAITETDWIKPGLVAWDWWNDWNITGVDFESGINNKTYKYYIDFASMYGLDYIILDEGWSESTTEILKCRDEINVEELVEVGKDKGVGVILWVLWKPLLNSLDEILDLYSSWGVKGIKVDFMQRADQDMVNYYEKIAAAAAKRRLIVDFHGAFKPAGMRRAYPNILSYEGLRGLEQSKWCSDQTPEHNVTLPFIRMVAGPMDYTPGAMINAHEKNFLPRWNRPMSMGTRCHQLAMYVVYESPLQMLCDNPTNYYKENECTDFISRIPTTWDETMVPESAVGKHIVIVRRKGENWYIGAMTGNDPYSAELDLSFLPEGKYNLEFFRDGINASKNAEDYIKDIQEADNTTTVELNLVAGGGWTGIISIQ